MAKYATLKATIDEIITTNGNYEISGEDMRNTLKAIVDSLGADYQFVGVATPATEPGTPDQNVVYLAGPGTYPNFGPTTVKTFQIGIFKYNGTWVYDILDLPNSWFININEVANHPDAYANAAAALADVPVAYRRKGVKVVYYDDVTQLWIEMLCYDDAGGANWWTDVENNWAVEGPIETKLATATGGQQLRIAGEKRGNLDDVLNVNVWNEQIYAYDSAALAHNAISANKRKIGLEIAFLLDDGWHKQMYIGPSTSDANWATESYWKEIPFKEIVDDLCQIIIDNPTIDKSKFQTIDTSSYEYEDGVMLYNGNIDTTATSYRTYTITNNNTGANFRTIAICGNFEGLQNLDALHRDIEITDENNRLILRDKLLGNKAILVKQGWTVRFSLLNYAVSKFYVQNVNSYPFISPSNLNPILDQIVDGLTQIVIDNPVIDSAKFTDIGGSSYPYVDGLLKTDGSIASISGYRTYTIQNSNTGGDFRFMALVGNFEGMNDLGTTYANIELKDNANNVLYRRRLQGYRAILIQQGFTLRFSVLGTYAKYFLIQNVTGICFNQNITLAEKTRYMDKNIVCWGDSLTAGAGGGGTTYPAVLATLIGNDFNVINAGVGGETSFTIAGRQGGRVFTLANDIVLPASGRVAISLTDYFGSPVAPLRQGGNNQISPCYVDGVKCTMTVEQTSITSEDYQLYLERVTAATGTRTIHAGTPIITNFMNRYQNAYALVIWIGTNGTFQYSGSGDTYENTLVDQIKAMIEYTNTRKVVVIGMHRVDNGTNTVANLLQLETLCGKVFGAKFIDWRKYLISNALSDAGITPTTADEQAISEGKCPPSLLSDAVHLNATGYTLLANLIYNRMLELGMI